MQYKRMQAERIIRWVSRVTQVYTNFWWRDLLTTMKLQEKKNKNRCPRPTDHRMRRHHNLGAMMHPMVSPSSDRKHSQGSQFPSNSTSPMKNALVGQIVKVPSSLVLPVLVTALSVQSVRQRWKKRSKTWINCVSSVWRAYSKAINARQVWKGRFSYWGSKSSMRH